MKTVGDSRDVARAAVMLAMTASREEEAALKGELLESGVAGAAREALSQVTTKALGLNVGGKIGVARCGEHVAVAVFFAIGLVHLNEVCIGMGHRSI